MDKVIPIETPDQELSQFLAMEPGPYKNFLYFNRIQGRAFRRANLSYKGDTLYYSSQILKAKRNGKSYYVVQSNKLGFTFENRKLKIWWGKNIKELVDLTSILKHLGMEWCSYRYQSFLTKGLFEKMLRKDITNPIDFCKAYLKVMRIKNVSPKLFNDLIVSGSTINGIVDRYTMFTAFEVAKDPNHFIEKCLQTDHINFLWTDLIKQALILNRKIDFLWSEKRMKSEHTEWTREIMNMEGENIDDKPIQSIKRFELLNGMTLLDSQKKVWMEGKMMNHCIYTNYWNPIQYGNYQAYHIDINNETATLGVTVDGNKIEFNQLQGIHNSNVSESLKKIIIGWIDAINHPKKQLVEL